MDGSATCSIKLVSMDEQYCQNMSVLNTWNTLPRNNRRVLHGRLEILLVELQGRELLVELQNLAISSITMLGSYTRGGCVRDPSIRLYSPSPLFFAPNFVMKSLLYGQACEKKQVSPLSLSHEMLSVIRKRLKGRARSVRHPSHAAHVAHLCVQSALPRDVPRREQADERSVLVDDDGVVDLFSLEQLRGVVPVHVGPRRVQVGAHDLAHGSVQWDLRRGGAGGEKLKKLFRELFAVP